jgi:hypothetical protein
MEAINNFALFRMFSDFAQSRGMSILGEGNHEPFLDELRRALEKHQQRPTLWHGLRIQSMFMYVAASLGECAVITEEDNGDFHAVDSEVKRPDFRILTRSNQELFIEVKNFNQKNPNQHFKIKGQYLSSLQRYTSQFHCDLKFAIYWARWRSWTLVSADRLKKNGDQYVLPFEEALIINEMNLLGDCMIGTVPPLSIKVLTDPSKPRTIDAEGKCELTIKRIALCCDGQEITDAHEQELAWFFMMFGNWYESETPADVKNRELISFQFQFTPEERHNLDQEFEIIGSLSQMISRQYNELTASEGKIALLCPEKRPDKLGVLIPRDYDYDGAILRLWKIQIKPNFDDTELEGL